LNLVELGGRLRAGQFAVLDWLGIVAICVTGAWLILFRKWR